MFTASSYVFSLLLVATGLAKFRRPEYTSGALSALGLPSGQFIVRALGLTEIAVGLGVLAGLGPIPVLAQTLLYLSFLAWIGYAFAREAPLETCGCLGREDTPPYWGHLAVNVLGVVVSLGALLTLSGAPPFSTGELIATFVIAAVGAALGWWLIGAAAVVTGRLTRI